MHRSLRTLLLTSLRRQKQIFDSSLILNPVENIPPKEWLQPASSFLHGLYSTDKLRTKTQQLAAKIQFAGRRKIAVDTNKIYEEWCRIIGASATSMRLLSGLHAHVIIFMAIGDVGNSVMLLPEKAGGHMATRNILLRLGYEIIDIPIDCESQSIDVEKTIALANSSKPDFLFIDRSEGLTYEDFTPIIDAVDCYCIYDASQYLTNIMAFDLKNPFDMGFDLVVSTIHKNFPGPQKAVVFTRDKDAFWERIINALSSYVSNFHPFSIYIAGLAVADQACLSSYSKGMLQNSVGLEKRLSMRGVPVVLRKTGLAPTHHLWVQCANKEEAFRFYCDLEFSRIITNYRLLPYGLGYGLRLGTSAATFSGLKEEHLDELADCMAALWFEGKSLLLKHRIKSLIQEIKR